MTMEAYCFLLFIVCNKAQNISVQLLMSIYDMKLPANIHLEAIRPVYTHVIVFIFYHLYIQFSECTCQMVFSVKDLPASTARAETKNPLYFCISEPPSLV